MSLPPILTSQPIPHFSSLYWLPDRGSQTGIIEGHSVGAVTGRCFIRSTPVFDTATLRWRRTMPITERPESFFGGWQVFHLFFF